MFIDIIYIYTYIYIYIYIYICIDVYIYIYIQVFPIDHSLHSTSKCLQFTGDLAGGKDCLAQALEVTNFLAKYSSDSAANSFHEHTSSLKKLIVVAATS